MINVDIMTLTDDDFDRFIKRCEEGGQPNQALIDAYEFTKESGITIHEGWNDD